MVKIPLLKILPFFSPVRQKWFRSCGICLPVGPNVLWSLKKFHGHWNIHLSLIKLDLSCSHRPAHRKHFSTLRGTKSANYKPSIFKWLTGVFHREVVIHLYNDNKHSFCKKSFCYYCTSIFNMPEHTFLKTIVITLVYLLLWWRVGIPRQNFNLKKNFNLTFLTHLLKVAIFKFDCCRSTSLSSDNFCWYILGIICIIIIETILTVSLGMVETHGHW